MADITIDAGGLSRILHVQDGGPDASFGYASVTMTGIVLTNGRADHGGAVLVDANDGYFKFIDGRITDSVAEGGGGDAGMGGGIMAANGSWAWLIDSALTGNQADIGGGGAAVASEIWVVGGLIADNVAAGHGGGLAMTDPDDTGSDMLIMNATVANNSAGIGGGAIASDGGFAAVAHSTFTGNQASVGAALLLAGEPGAFTGAPADAEAGAPDGGFLIMDSVIAGNGADADREIATYSGGAFYFEQTALLAGRIFDTATGEATTPETAFDRIIGDPVYDPENEIWIEPTEPAVATLITLSDLPDIGLADVFDAIDPITGGGLLTENGGAFASVALKADVDNPAVDAASSQWLSDGSGDFDSPDARALAHDANGGPRAVAFLSPLGEALVDLGAAEAVRQTAPSLTGALPDGAPAFADFADGAADLTADAARLDNAAFVNFGADDRIQVRGATNVAQFSHDGTTLIYDADGDGVAEAKTHLTLAPRAALRLTAGAEGVTIAAEQAAAIGEVVALTVGTSWQTLTFANTYVDPVVFALAPTLNEAEAAATRFRDVTGTGAQIRLQEPKKAIDPETGLKVVNASGHVDETVTLLVLEKGTHILEDGTIIQAGELSTSKLYVKGFEDVAFAEDFDTTPSIFSQVQTYDGTDFIVSRQRNPDGSGFQLTMQEEQADNRNHAAEDVGWFAIEHGSGSLSQMDWQAGSSAQNVNGKLTKVAFDDAFDAAPLVVASLASYNGTDTASPRIGSVDGTRFTAMALEDRSHDLETNHGYEIVDWMAFSAAGTIYEQTPEAFKIPEPVRVATTGFASVASEPTTISFGAGFANPIVIATLTSAHEAGAALARVSNVTATGFDLAVQETGEQDGVHGAEDVSWIVVEAGSWRLADGTILEAGLQDVGSTTRQGFASVALDAGFAAGPAVLSQTQTANDAAFVKTRMKDVGAAGFAVALEEDEAASWGAHGTETVGWIAVDMGAAADSDGFVFEAGDLRANHAPADQAFAAAFDAAPGVVIGAASFAGSDAAAARVDAIDAAGFTAHLQEDVSLNAEITHGREDLHWLAFDGAGDIWGDALG